tara:strand:+ start:5112 stop:7802 length:2691 start_codon:yes stop_codon:yes gene_type:complete
MSLETINSVDINFSNGAGGHTATVNSTVDVKNSDGSPSLGVVDGEIGSKNYFSKDEINNIMSRFICTSLTKNQGPIGLTVSRKYSDITSLTLNSYLVMVRGVNAPPDNSDSFEGMFPFFSEVKGSPLKSYPSTSVREIEGKRILVVGRIYNYESATVLNGLKVSLVYNDQELKKNLCLNQDTVTQPYKDSPSLVNYTLKFGYTLNEYLEMLDHVGIVHKGLENVENGDTILFENSGTLADVTSAIAAYFGYYYFIDPNTGHLNFIDSRIASDIEITDFTQTTDENIVSATFTEDKFTPEIVNAYVGSADKPSINTEQGRFKFGDGGDGNGRSTKLNFFQLTKEDTTASNGDIALTSDVISLYYMFFALGFEGSKHLFDIYTYALMLNNFLYRPKFRILFPQGGDNGGLQFNNLENFPKRLIKFERNSFCRDAKSPQKHELGIIDTFAIRGAQLSLDGQTITKYSIHNSPEEFLQNNVIKDDANVKRLAKVGKLPNAFDNINGLTEAAAYPISYQAIKGADGEPIQVGKPSESDLFSFLQGYFEFAGGLYITSGMSEDKASRLVNIEDKGFELLGPFDKDTTFADAADEQGVQAEVFQWLINYRGFTKASKIRELTGAALFGQKDVGDFHYIAVKKWARAATIPRVRGGDQAGFIKEQTDKYRFLLNMADIEESDAGSNTILIESRDEAIGKKDLFDRVTELATVSRFGYRRAVKEAANLDRRQFQMNAEILKKRIRANDDQEQEDKEENNQLVGDPVDNEKLKELLQRYDLKSFNFDAPKTDQYTPLSLVVANGSTVEVNALREATQKSYLETPPKNLKSSSKTIYGLEIPSEFKITTSSFQIRVGSDGITTTIGESTLKLIPPTKEFIVNQAMETIGTPSINPRLRSTQRNYLGL